VRAHVQETTDRQNSAWLLAVACHQEVVNLADSFVCVVKDAATDDLGRPIAGRQPLLTPGRCFVLSARRK
jgi:hypothetical protein